MATALMIGLIMLAMALGVLISGRRLRGSCGGLANGDYSACPCDESKREACARKERRRSAPTERSLTVWQD